MTKQFALFSFITALLLGLVLFTYTANRPQILAFLNEQKLLPQPEKLTELYFTNHMALQTTVQSGEPFEFSFTINNLEYQPKDYIYQVLAINEDATEVLSQDSVFLNHEASKIITNTYTVTTPGRTKIQIVLPDTSQPIHFYVYISE